MLVDCRAGDSHVSVLTTKLSVFLSLGFDQKFHPVSNKLFPMKLVKTHNPDKTNAEFDESAFF